MNPSDAGASNATAASGVALQIEPRDPLAIVELNDTQLAVHATGGFFSTSHQYLTSYRGPAFFTKSSSERPLPADCQLVEAKKIWIPG